MDTKAMKAVYTVTERAGKSFWTRVGVAMVNRDGSWNVKLDAIPVNGSLQIREWEPRDEQRRGEAEVGVANGGPNARRGRDAEAPLV